MWDVVTNGTKFRLRDTVTGNFHAELVCLFSVVVEVPVSYVSLEDAKADRAKLEAAAAKYKKENNWIKVEDPDV